MSFRVAIDVGGTFTDMICIDDTGEVNLFKSSSTPPNLIEGTLNVLGAAAKHYNIGVDEFLSQCAAFMYGTTIATNAIVSGTAAKTGLICTKGHRDILLIRHAGKEDTYRLARDFPEPYVPRYLTFGVTERMNSEGGVETPLDTDEVRAAVRQLKAWNVEAIAVCLLFSTINPAHENKIGEIIKEEYPGVFYCLSHEVNPVLREYWRTSCTAINASLARIVSEEIAGVSEALKRRRFSGALSFVTISGGQTSAESIAARPILLADSGPSMGPVAGLYIGNTETGANNVITIDMGGTSFDVSVVTDGAVGISREGKLGDNELGMPAVDLKVLGAGGGSIAWIDAAGAVRVGPRSAGAVPGPVCYVQGGVEPTVTDANVVRGLLNPDYFLGGTMKLSAEAAEKVIEEKVAKPTGLSTAEAAALICATCEQNMIGGIESITMRQGVDPRGYLMVAGGAAAGLHAVPIARALGIEKVLIPKVAGGMSAFGAAISDVKYTFATSLPTNSRQFDYERVNRVLDDLVARAENYLAGMGIPSENRVIELSVEAQYPQQVWQIPIPLKVKRFSNEKEVTGVANDFHATHDRLYSSKDVTQTVEFVTWTAAAIGKPSGRVSLREQKPGSKEPSAALKGKRRVYLKQAGGFVEVPIYAGEKLVYQNCVEGPAVIEEAETTVGIFPKSKATVTRYGSYLIDVELEG